MRAKAVRTISTTVLLVGLCLAQQPPKEPLPPTFRAQTDLVTVAFQVRRGSGSISDLKPSDVVLLEDGNPRAFTVFEAPPSHLTLDLVVMFDVTKPPPDQKRRRVWFWDAKALQDLASYWSEAIARRLLDEHLDEHRATIRFSIYRFDQSKLQRLCRSTSDPKVLSDALHRLSARAGQASGQDVDIPLPAALAVRARERKAQADGHPPQPWSLAGALAALRDSTVDPGSNKEEPAGADKAMAARALVIFSTGAEGTSITPQDLAGQAVAAGVPIYPVGLFTFPPILPYDGYGFDGKIFYDDERVSRSMWGPAGPYIPIWGPADRPDLPADSPPVALYFNYPFELLGDLTGGLRFESPNHSQPLGKSGQRFVLGYNANLVFSMTGAETEDILVRVKRHALARFISNYTVGFVPSPSDSPREHKLEVKLAPKSSGRVSEGKRSATY
jgi:hypothetical protein